MHYMLVVHDMLQNAIDEIDQLPVAAAKQLANDWLEVARPHGPRP